MYGLLLIEDVTLSVTRDRTPDEEMRFDWRPLSQTPTVCRATHHKETALENSAANRKRKHLIGLSESTLFRIHFML